MPVPDYDWTPAAASPPVMPYASLFTDADGLSRLAMCQLAGFDTADIGNATDLWKLDFPGRVVGVSFVVLPVGWTGDWHESPHPQWVVPLSGAWFLESAGGERLVMGPGEIHWGQDVGTAGEKGHRSGQSGDLPCVQLLVQFAESHGAGACPLPAP